ncbi:aldehyde dehydrogenase 3 member H1 [Aspergillus viridinutans]|uniref:Aldehyde dehydrogenase 3 member H1 n=1 Tax=Aspergillus viridinutans TaxID=75553 RepID=A0A9P3F7R8_ASPVI|nr:aldehyde dehydrogenase 3 member H1 [Aspergillus viridinutans]GIK04528.1 aldehyde dehydrogenase 3 member H1 [Aspergillus viridinutans]
MGPFTSEAEVEEAYNTMQATPGPAAPRSSLGENGQIKQLWRPVEDNKDHTIKVVNKDPGRHAYKTSFTEVMAIQTDIVRISWICQCGRSCCQSSRKHLTPTVRELGGQCPAIVTKTTDIEDAAKNIACVKYLTWGQICLSVSHFSAHPSVQKKLIERMTFYFNEFNNKGDLIA